ncbi:MAG: hypothetical protein ACLRZ2_00185 [Veillonella sp.]
MDLKKASLRNRVERLVTRQGMERLYGKEDK